MRVPDRNALCPCGSGRKYKKCCLGKEGATSKAQDAGLDDGLRRLKTKMSPAGAEAREIADEIIVYVRALLPIRISESDNDAGAQAQWIAVRVTDTLEAVFLLGQAGLHEDASALVRVMVDHLLAFAWILADDKPPTRMNSWKNNDLRLMNAQKREAASLGVDVAAPPQPIETTVSWASAGQAARECDDFWEPHLKPFLKKGTLNSFAGLYAAVFRATSAHVHPSLRGAHGFFLVPKGTDAKEMRIGTSYATLPDTYSDAVVIALLTVWIVAARFRHTDVPRIVPLFDRVVAMRAAMDKSRPPPAK